MTVKSAIETTNWLQCETINKVVEILNTIPREYMCIQEDCNREDVVYRTEDVVQIRPSTHPLFWLKKLGLVVKILYDKEKVENEKRARLVLKSSFSLVPMSFASYDNGFLEIMPYIDESVMLSEVSKTDLSEFTRIYDKMSARIYHYIICNRKPALKNQNVIYAGRSLECMQQWTSEMIGLLEGYNLFSYTTGLDYNLSGVMKAVLDELKNITKNTCVFSGDMNCHNILSAKTDVFLIDFEYWGNFDVEYLISVLLGSLFSHCDLFEKYHIEREEKIIKAKYSLRIDLSEIESLRILQKAWVNCDRIKTFILARMYYKFIDIIKNPKESKHTVVVCALLDFFSNYNEVYKK